MVQNKFLNHFTLLLYVRQVYGIKTQIPNITSQAELLQPIHHRLSFQSSISLHRL